MRRKTICGARRKYDGQPCQCKALTNGRCKLHGGMSTGPKTAEGRARISAAVKARWLRSERKEETFLEWYKALKN
jgi:hypothetical protein